MIVKNIPYVGLDFILTPQGDPVFIEANDHPVGLFSWLQENSSRREKITRSLQSFAESMCQVVNGGLACFIVPDCFVIKEPDLQKSYIKIPSNIDPGYVVSLKEFNEISRLLRVNGVGCVVVNAKDLIIKDNDCYFKNEKISLLFRRANYFPPIPVNCFCVNDIRARALCLDKKRTHDFLRPFIKREFLPPEISQDTKFVIKKPRYGHASKFIERKTLTGAREAGWFSLSSADWLIQEWVEPSRTLYGEWEYYFDLRVFLLDGRVVSIIARHSAYPINTRIIYDTYWLTTTGHDVLVYPCEDSLFHKIAIRKESIVRIKWLSEEIVKILDSIIGELLLTEEVKIIPSLGSIWGVQGEMEITELELENPLEKSIGNGDRT